MFKKQELELIEHFFVGKWFFNENLLIFPSFRKFFQEYKIWYNFVDEIADVIMWLLRLRYATELQVSPQVLQINIMV